MSDSDTRPIETGPIETGPIEIGPGETASDETGSDDARPGDSGADRALVSPTGWSLWAGAPDESGRPLGPRARGALTADVCVVGAGYTGLWTAYHLARTHPALRVVVVEKETVGFGASGRNGGWCSALFPTAALAAQMRPALAAAIDEIGAIAREEGIDCDFVKAGTLRVATTPAQATRLRRTAGTEWLDANEVAGIVRVAGAEGGVLDPDCAVLHPGRLVRGLAAAAERRGVTVFERSPARRIVPGRVVLDGGVVRADVIVRATEGYTATLPGLRREVAPIYSLVVATEPLSPATWDDIGWERRVAVTDDRHMIIYAQRTADGRIVLGGEGTPYHFGSRIRPSFDVEPAVFDHLRQTLATLFPAAATARITHRWGGPLGVPRDWTPSVHLDRATGLAHAGGYVGDGVAASALAGQTLAELITGRSSERTGLPWVRGERRRWEPEPLRWLGITGGTRLARAVDARENRTGRPSRLGSVLAALTGGR
ncbi:FAD-binding oxidoreductase [Parafrankia sp. EUN1f]|uniref:NAD(P)/FAD-dependent oxidoreductase n=1 Tax=Parafrankia sp. EUN1f TaxID=102897 RepID=UPI0001C4711E|nr:FAD dependent oxidoreductase [Parafrankia sp. EUN1f]